MSDLKFLKKVVREAIAREKYGLLTEVSDEEVEAARAEIHAARQQDAPELAALVQPGIARNQKRDPDFELNTEMKNLHDLIQKIEKIDDSKEKEKKDDLKMHVALGLFNIGTELQDKMQMLASKDSEVGPSADTKIVGKTTSGEKTSVARKSTK